MNQNILNLSFTKKGLYSGKRKRDSKSFKPFSPFSLFSFTGHLFSFSESIIEMSEIIPD